MKDKNPITLADHRDDQARNDAVACMAILGLLKDGDWYDEFQSLTRMIMREMDRTHAP